MHLRLPESQVIDVAAGHRIHAVTTNELRVDHKSGEVV